MILEPGSRKRIYRVLVKYADESVETVSDFEHLDIARKWCRNADRSEKQTYGILPTWK